MLRIKTALPVLLSGAVLSAGALAAPSVYPTGVTRYDPAKAFNQYVIFSGADKQTHLIDMNGNEVHHKNLGRGNTALLDRKMARDVANVRIQKGMVLARFPRT